MLSKLVRLYISFDLIYSVASFIILEIMFRNVYNHVFPLFCRSLPIIFLYASGFFGFMSLDVYLVYGLKDNQGLESKHAIVPIEMTRDHLGFLIGDNLHGGALENVLYVRTQDELNVRHLSMVQIAKADGFSVVYSQGYVLPLPSRLPYRVCEIPSDLNLLLRSSFRGGVGKSKQGLENVVQLMKIVGFSSKKPWFRSRRLITPEGYADQAVAYAGMNAREEDRYGCGLDRGSRNSSFLERRR